MSDLWNSIWKGSLPSAKKCLDRGADVNYRSFSSTCLILAVTQNNEEIVSLLLEQPGIDVNAKMLSGQTALHESAGT